MILNTLWCNYWPFVHLLLLKCLFISPVHFLNLGVVCLFIIDLQELFTYSWYKSLVRCMRCDHFSQSDLSIYFSWFVFLKAGILNFEKVQLTFLKMLRVLARILNNIYSFSNIGCSLYGFELSNCSLSILCL